eukprot:gene17320-biopygen14398
MCALFLNRITHVTSRRAHVPGRATGRAKRQGKTARGKRQGKTARGKRQGKTARKIPTQANTTTTQHHTQQQSGISKALPQFWWCARDKPRDVPPDAPRDAPRGAPRDAPRGASPILPRHEWRENCQDLDVT